MYFHYQEYLLLLVYTSCNVFSCCYFGKMPIRIFHKNMASIRCGNSYEFSNDAFSWNFLNTSCTCKALHLKQKKSFLCVCTYMNLYFMYSDRIYKYDLQSFASTEITIEERTNVLIFTTNSIYRINNLQFIVNCLKIESYTNRQTLDALIFLTIWM